MKNAILSTLLFAVMVIGGSQAAKAMPAMKDSIIVKLKNNTIVLYGENPEELKAVLQYDLNAIFADLIKEMEASPDGKEKKVSYEDLNGTKYRVEGSAREVFSIKVIEQGSTDTNQREVKIDTVIRDDHQYVIMIDKNRLTKEEDSLKIKKYYHHRSKSSSPRQGFNIDLGMNNFINNKPGKYNMADYDLRPFGSRYISLGATRSARLAKGKNATLYMDFGIDFSWHNLMFDNNNTVVKRLDGVNFEPILNPEGQVTSLSKSKLTIPHVNLSLMPTLAFRRSFIDYLSAGVYGGYRIGGYTKTKISDSRNKNRVKDNYYMNDFRYGIALELGIKKFPDFFFNCDLNSVFAEEKGPHIQMISFGIRI